MNRSQHSIIQFLQFAIEKENLIVWLNFKPFSSMAVRSFFFIAQYWILVLKRGIAFCYEGDGLVGVHIFSATKSILKLRADDNGIWFKHGASVRLYKSYSYKHFRF